MMTGDSQSFDFEAEAQQHMAWASREWVEYFKDLPDYDSLLLASLMNVIKIKEGTPDSLVTMLANSAESCGGVNVGAFADFFRKVVEKAKPYQKNREAKDSESVASVAKNADQLKRRLENPQNRVEIDTQGVVSPSNLVSLPFSWGC
jgi:hypothetical protein